MWPCHLVNAVIGALVLLHCDDGEGERVVAKYLVCRVKQSEEPSLSPTLTVYGLCSLAEFLRPFKASVALAVKWAHLSLGCHNRIP